MVFAKQHLNEDTQVTKNRSNTLTASQIVSYLTSFGKENKINAAQT